MYILNVPSVEFSTITLTIQLKAAYSSETLVSTYILQPTTPQDIKTQKTTIRTIHVTKLENLYKIGGNMNLTLNWCHWNYFKFNEGTSKRVSTVYLCNGQNGYWCFSGTQCRLQGTSSTLLTVITVMLGWKSNTNTLVLIVTVDCIGL